jgi:hypothetical protein
MRREIIVILGLCLFIINTISAQLHEGKYKGAIYQEKDVPKYVLPEVLTGFDGKKINTVDDWEKIRRPEIINFFAENMYGKVPSPSDPIIETFELISEDTAHLDGLCTKREVRITLENKFGKVFMPLVLFVPNSTSKPVPAIYLFNGDDIRRRRLELDGPQGYGKTKNGIPLKQLMLREIGVVTIDGKAFGRDYGDKEGKVRGGIVDLFFEPGQKYTKAYEWGMIAVWAYAMRIGMNYIETDTSINPKQVAVLGCSVSGKVALWAAATDERFGMTLLATAGHGGDAIWRRQLGETLDNMCTYLPTWICRNANKYAKDINSLPVDQHTLLATLAPRPLYVSNAHHDLWADQKGQWIGTYNATPAYELYGNKVEFTSPEQPPLDSPIVESAIGYHVRSGFHGLTLYDWERYMEFIEYHFMKIPIRSVHDIYYPNRKLVDHYPNMNGADYIVK